MQREEHNPDRLVRRITPAAREMARQRVAGSPMLQVLATQVQGLLVGSEGLLLRALRDDLTPTRAAAAPSPFNHPEFAHVPYWLNYPATDAMRAVADLWKSIYGQLPPTRLDPATTRQDRRRTPRHLISSAPRAELSRGTR